MLMLDDDKVIDNIHTQVRRQLYRTHRREKEKGRERNKLWKFEEVK